jgi:hypothetical protein
MKCEIKETIEATLQQFSLVSIMKQDGEIYIDAGMMQRELGARAEFVFCYIKTLVDLFRIRIKQISSSLYQMLSRIGK